jgi:hypothetical protein
MNFKIHQHHFFSWNDVGGARNYWKAETLEQKKKKKKKSKNQGPVQGPKQNK